MKHLLRPTVFAVVSALAAAPVLAAPMQVDSAKIINALHAGEAQWNADIVARDPVKFASHYDDTATVMNPGGPVLHGRAAVEASMRQTFADPNFTLTFAADSVGVSSDGMMAWTQGHCTETETSTTTHAKITQPCAYLTVYKMEADGSWKAFEDIATPTAP